MEHLTKAASSNGWYVDYCSQGVLTNSLTYTGACHRSLVQPTLTSALQGWGVGSLDQDAKDILQLTMFLKAEHSSQVPAAACLVPRESVVNPMLFELKPFAAGCHLDRSLYWLSRCCQICADDTGERLRCSAFSRHSLASSSKHD